MASNKLNKKHENGNRNKNGVERYTRQGKVRKEIKN